MFSIAPMGQRPSSSGPSGASSIGEALELVRARVLADKVYEPWDRNGQCLRFLGEGESQAEFDVLIREQHSSACGGDPETSPVVDRFRVLRNTKTMLWLNYSGEYVPYEEFRDERLRQLSLDPSAALPDPPSPAGIARFRSRDSHPVRWTPMMPCARRSPERRRLGGSGRGRETPAKSRGPAHG